MTIPACKDCVFWVQHEMDSPLGYCEGWIENPEVISIVSCDKEPELETTENFSCALFQEYSEHEFDQADGFFE